MLRHVAGFLERLRPAEDAEGQGLAEYALILGLIAVVAIIALMFVGNGVSGTLSTVGSNL